MNHAICCVPVSPLRSEPAHRSEMVSQQLFGELCTIIESARDFWIKVKCAYDGYEGWCQESHVTGIDEADYLAAPAPLTAGWINEILYNGSPMVIPIGSSLTGIKGQVCNWGRNTVYFSGDIWPESAVFSDEKTLREIAFSYLNSSYLWGGKSVFGIDCSGFVQTVFKFFGITLLRDAWLQATQGEAVRVLQEARCGDLAFFDNPEGRIVHVGLLLNDHEIIHSSGKVRVDRIDSEGILNSETLERTHHLRLIKRYFGEGGR